MDRINAVTFQIEEGIFLFAVTPIIFLMPMKPPLQLGCHAWR
jgi:hypothetical protein